jgi:hypothetical protein
MYSDGFQDFEKFSYSLGIDHRMVPDHLEIVDERAEHNFAVP